MSRVVTRRVVLAGAGLVGLSTAATSAVSLYELAARCGIPEPFAAALPIALDAGAAVAALVWITERDGLRRWGRAVAVAALAGTIVGNGVQHALAAGLLAATLPLVLAVGAAIPAMLWCIAHLLAMMTAVASPVVAGKPAAARVRRPGKAATGPPVEDDEMTLRRRAAATAKKQRQRAALRDRKRSASGVAGG